MSNDLYGWLSAALQLLIAYALISLFWWALGNPTLIRDAQLQDALNVLLIWLVKDRAVAMRGKT